MPAKKIVSERQLEIMTTYMEENRGFAVGRLSNNGPLAKQQAQQRWEELATTLNSVGAGTTRSSAKWRDYWNEKKYGVRRKVTEHREHGSATGRGPAKKWSLTPMEERIFAIIGREAVMGNTSVQVPLHHTQPAPSAALGTAVASPPASAPVPEPEPALNIEQEFSFSESTSATATSADVPMPTSLTPPPRLAPTRRRTMPTSLTPPPRLAPTRRRSYTPHAAEVPQWAMQIEERHLANEERLSRSMEAIAATMAAMQRSVAHIEELLVTALTQ